MAIAVVLSVIKNPDKKAKLKKALLKVRNQINFAYKNDPEFAPNQYDDPTINP
jgi:hypothetical protein